MGIVTVFVQVCGARYARGGEGGTDGDLWGEIRNICGNIKHAVQGTFMDEGARRLKERLGLLEGYCRWRGERGQGKKEQKKLKDFGVGKGKVEKGEGERGEDETEVRPPPSPEV